MLPILKDMPERLDGEYPGGKANLRPALERRCLSLAVNCEREIGSGEVGEAVKT